jgi:hypothetical protein
MKNKKMKVKSRNVHMKPTQADTEMLLAYVSKAADKIASNRCS